MPVIELPMTMPASGMTYCGRYHGSTCTITPVTAKVTMKPVSAIDTNALPKMPGGASGLRLHEDAGREQHHQHDERRRTSHGELMPNTQRSTNPSASSCT